MVSFSFDLEKDIAGKIELKDLTLKDGRNEIARTEDGVTLWATGNGSQIVYWTSLDKDNNPLDTFVYYKAELNQISQSLKDRKDTQKGEKISERGCFIVCTASIPPKCWFVCPDSGPIWV
jgi:hypothetical protein